MIYTGDNKTAYGDLPSGDFRVTTVGSGGGGGGGGRESTVESVEVPDWALGAAVVVILAWALGVF